MTKELQKIKRQSNALSNAAYSLPRNSKRLMYLSLDSLADYTKLRYDRGEAGYAVEIDHAVYSDCFNASSHASRDILAAAKALRKNGIIMYTPENDGDDGEKALIERNWINAIDHNPKSRKTTLFFHPNVVETLRLDKNTPFTRYLLKNVANLSNPNTMRLYETICQWRNSRSSYTLNIQWCLDRYQLPKSYARTADFRDKFLKKAVAEINQHTDINILEVQELCNGKRANTVTDIKIFWEQKPNLALDDKKGKPFDPTREQAIDTYMAISQGSRIPTKEELYHLQGYLKEFESIGWNIKGEFAERFLDAITKS